MDALYVCNDPLVTTHRVRINTLALGVRLPAMSFLDLYRRTADFVDQILRGAKPADIPVEQPAKFELVINLKTAKTLGLSIPQTLLLRADQVIE